MKLLDFRWSYLFFLVLAVGYAFFTLLGPHGVPSWMQKRRDIQAFEQRIEALQRENDRREERIRSLEQDQAEQERVIREQLIFVKEDETVYVLGR